MLCARPANDRAVRMEGRSPDALRHGIASCGADHSDEMIVSSPATERYRHLAALAQRRTLLRGSIDCRRSFGCSLPCSSDAVLATELRTESGEAGDEETSRHGVVDHRVIVEIACADVSGSDLPEVSITPRLRPNDRLHLETDEEIFHAVKQ